MKAYRFSEFVLAPSRRVLLRNGREVARYFDLLILLVEQKRPAGDAMTSDTSEGAALMEGPLEWVPR